jgi:hypothetical protein
MFRDTRDTIRDTSPAFLTVGFWMVVFVVGAAALGLGIYWVTQPTTVAIQNRTFHESQAYNDGMARDLSDLQMAYMRADDAGKSTIRATVQQRFAGYDARRLPPNLQMFLTEMQ